MGGWRSSVCPAAVWSCQFCVLSVFSLVELLTRPTGRSTGQAVVWTNADRRNRQDNKSSRQEFDFQSPISKKAPQRPIWKWEIGSRLVVLPTVCPGGCPVDFAPLRRDAQVNPTTCRQDIMPTSNVEFPTSPRWLHLGKWKFEVDFSTCRLLSCRRLSWRLSAFVRPPLCRCVSCRHFAVQVFVLPAFCPAGSSTSLSCLPGTPAAEKAAAVGRSGDYRFLVLVFAIVFHFSCDQ